MSKYYIFIALLLYTLHATAQSNPACLVHLDKSFYVTGEVIWFKIYLPPHRANHDFMIRVGLLDQNGDVKDYFFLPTEGKTYAHGYYKIPYDWASGMYQLAFAAQEQASKQNITLAKIMMPIYNDLEKQDTSNVFSPEKQASIAEINTELNIEITFNQSNYQSRDQVQASVQVKDAAGVPVRANVSVAVIDWALSGDNVLPQPSIHSGFPLTDTALENHIFLRMKQLEEAGTTKNLFGIYVAQDWQMHYASTNEKGLFFITIPPFYQEKSLQILGYPNPIVPVAMDDPLRSAPAPPLPYTKGIREYLELSRQRKKIFQFYNTLETNLLFEEINQKPAALMPDRTLRMAEYESFEDMATFFKEVLTSLSFKLDKKQNRYVARMYNPGTQDHYKGTPLFIIDGKITRDADFVARLKMNQLAQIDLYYIFSKINPNFKIIGNSGVVNIQSKTGISIPEAEAKGVFNIIGMQVPAPFPLFPQASTEQSLHSPFFRPQLYWNPSLETDNQGNARFDFTQSDDLSTFRIQVIAQSEDGRIGIATQFYAISK